VKGIVFTGQRNIELRDFPDPTPGPGEVVLEIKASGMCGSDLHYYRSEEGAAAMAKALGIRGAGPEVIAGHEPCGVVVARGAGVEERFAPIGARVMVHHYDGCGICPSCRQGWAQLCEDAFTIYGVTGDGAHAPYMKVPANTLVTLPDGLNFAEGAAISCGTGTAYAAIKRMDLPAGATLAVFGQGPVGLSVTLLGAAMGARVIAVDISKERLELGKSLGADALINAETDDPIEAIHELTFSHGADYTMECIGLPETRIASIRSTRVWGTTCFVGEGKDVTIDVSKDLLRRQLTLIGSWTFNTIRQGECATFCVEHDVPVDKVFTHRYALEQADEAYELFDTQSTGKGVFVF
tara:strand:+ start:1614 stop:2669 length:1056 start_codon:yes stop_codon:yes gene_type:complete